MDVGNGTNNSTGTGPPTPPRLPPRAHRVTRLPLNNNTIQTHNVASPPPQPPAPLSLSQPAPVITALAPRSHTRQNVYVDTPRRHTNAPLASVHKNGTTVTKTLSATLTSNNTVQSLAGDDADVITSQPLEPIKPDSRDHEDSVICLQCRKCKCSSCTDPRQLPSRWVCGYNVSAESIVETCTCYCCLKGAFYHMFKDTEMDEDVMSESDPCACCEQRHCCQRWTCVGLMTVCLPCLCCFPPLKCLVQLATNCYNCCNRRGCRCQKQRRQSGSKRLLDSSDGSSS